MQVDIKTNYKQLVKELDDVAKKQVPFATSNAINKTLFGLRKFMGQQTLHYMKKPTPFTKRGFLVEPSKYKGWKKLKGILYIRPEVLEYLQYLIDGGIETAKRKIPIPYTWGGNIVLNRYGNIKGKRFGLIKNKRQFIATIKGISGVWERAHRRRDGTQNKPKLLIAFRASAQYKPIFPYFKIAEGYIKYNFNKKFAEAIEYALSEKKKK
jgi:hypothetical protein